MIVDCYTRTWESPEQLGRGVLPNGPGPGQIDSDRQPVSSDRKVRQAATERPGLSEQATTLTTRLAGADQLAMAGQLAGADAVKHWAAIEPVDTTFVLGFKSEYLDAEISNDQVSAYVHQHPERLVGFAGIDPSCPKEAVEEMVRARNELSMRGVAVAPAAQNFHPTDSQAMMVYAEAAKLGMPILFDTGIYISPATKLEYARPVLLDEIARELPDLRIIIAHMGYPWTNETIVLLAKHPHVYAEISWLLAQPWQAYQTLLSAYQFGVMDKLLFGSGFPQDSPSHGIEELYGISHMIHETNLPSIPREQLRGIVERNALTLLNIPNPGATQAVTNDNNRQEKVSG